jgi:N-acetylglucosaminyldiphosphoundecaprenol N-acetyl-beta-D-mannosaminyltransferase
MDYRLHGNDEKGMNIFGIKINELTKKQVLKKVDEFLVDKKQHYIVTPNPEILLQAGKDEEYFYVLNKADLSVPDGIGLKLASWMMFKNLKIYTGADLTLDLLKMAGKKNLKVGIVNWLDGLSDKNSITAKLQITNYKLHVSIIDLPREAKLPIGSLASLIDYKPDILFCSFGAPYQEKFIWNNLKNFPSVKIAIGVGTSFDYISGKIKRAPKLFRKCGLEWLWRLFKILLTKNNDVKIYKTNRVKRIYRAVFKFPIKFFKWRFILPFLYRKNVVCFLYKKELDKIKVLLVERQGEPGHWQLPQGGVDKDDLLSAGKRELSEEIGNNNFKALKVIKNIHQYKFGYNKNGIATHRAGEYQRHTDYKGQRQGLFIAEYFGKDEDIKINNWDHSAWKWVDIRNLISELHPIRRDAAEIILKKFNETVK